MSQEIAVIGGPEFTTGFRLAGVRRFENVAPDEKDEGIGIVVMHDDDLEYLSRSTRNAVDTSVEPVFVTLGSGAAGGSGLREQIKRAIGIDLMAEEGDSE